MLFRDDPNLGSHGTSERELSLGIEEHLDASLAVDRHLPLEAVEVIAHFRLPRDRDPHEPVDELDTRALRRLLNRGWREIGGLDGLHELAELLSGRASQFAFAAGIVEVHRFFGRLHRRLAAHLPFRLLGRLRGRFSGLGRFRHLGAACLLRTGRKKGIGADASGVQEVHGSRFVMRLSRHFSLTLEKLYGT